MSDDPSFKRRWEQHKRDGGKMTYEQFVARRCKHKSQAKPNHSLDKATKLELANEIFGDMPDGAFFAAAGSEFGLSPEDFCG